MTRPFNISPAAFARYASVKHLSNNDAAKALGCAAGTIKRMRSAFPELKPSAPVADLCKPQRREPRAERPGIITHAIPMAEPCRSSSVSSVPVMRVSLPAPPWGGTFERNGVAA